MFFDRDLLACLTAPGSDFPQFINLSYVYPRNGQPDHVSLTVRGPKKDDKPGETLELLIAKDDFTLLLAAAYAKWNKVLANE